MLAHVLLAAGLGAALAAPAPVTAGPPSPACHLVRDAAGDVRAYGTRSPVAGATSVDVVGADIATSRTRLAAVFRVVGLRDGAPAAGAEPVTSRGYRLTFPAEGGTWLVAANLDGASPLGTRSCVRV